MRRGPRAAAARPRCVTSPLHRAADTAREIAAVLGVPVEVDDRLVELDYGEWDGRRLDEVERGGVGAVAQRSVVRAAGWREPRRRSARVSATFCAERLLEPTRRSSR